MFDTITDCWVRVDVDKENDHDYLENNGALQIGVFPLPFHCYYEYPGDSFQDGMQRHFEMLWFGGVGRELLHDRVFHCSLDIRFKENGKGAIEAARFTFK